MQMGFFEKLADELPAIITRKDISKYFGSFISPKYLANLDSQKKGPLKYRIGHKVVYKKEDFIAWLEARIEPC